MSLFEENEELLEQLELVEARVEELRVRGGGSAPAEEKRALALELKRLLARLAGNVAAAGGDVQQLGGALVLVDLLEVLGRYREVFDLPGLEQRLTELQRMWEDSR